MEEKILTQHPQGKKGVNILKRRYDSVLEVLLASIKKHGEVPFTTLCSECEAALEGKFDGKVMWYVEHVKLDLEAKGVIERVPKVTPHQLRMKG